MSNKTDGASAPKNDPGIQNSPQISKVTQEFKKKYIEGSNPFLNAGIISRTFYGWMNPILKVSANL